MATSKIATYKALTDTLKNAKKASASGANTSSLKKRTGIKDNTQAISKKTPSASVQKLPYKPGTASVQKLPYKSADSKTLIEAAKKGIMTAGAGIANKSPKSSDTTKKKTTLRKVVRKKAASTGKTPSLANKPSAKVSRTLY